MMNVLQKTYLCRSDAGELNIVCIFLPILLAYFLINFHLFTYFTCLPIYLFLLPVIGKFWNIIDCSVWNRDSVSKCVAHNGTLLRNGSCVVNKADFFNDDNASLSVLTSFDISANVMPSAEYFQFSLFIFFFNFNFYFIHSEQCIVE